MEFVDPTALLRDEFWITDSRMTEEQRTPELCLMAVTECGEALFHIKEEKRTYDICLAAVKNSCNGFRPNDSDEMALKFVPGSMRTPELLLAAVRRCGNALKHIPAENQTLEICLAAVRQSEKALKFVREDLVDTVKDIAKNVFSL
jgi:hypothetical protein